MSRRTLKKIVLILTTACNFRCRTCLREHPAPKHFPLQELGKLLPILKSLKIRRIAISGGEPGLHPEFEKVVEMIVNEGLLFSIVSNGSLLERYKDITARFGDNLTSMRFSLDGSDAEVHDFIRQEGSFEQVTGSIKYFVSQGTNTTALMCVNKLNMGNIEGVVNLSKGLGVKSIGLIDAIETPVNKNIVLNETEIELVSKKVTELIRQNPKIKITSQFFQRPYGVEFCPNFNLSNLSINPDMEVMFCCNNTPDCRIIGSLKTESFADIYCRAIEMAAVLRKIRVKMLTEGHSMQKFNSCEFCNSILRNP